MTQRVAEVNGSNLLLCSGAQEATTCVTGVATRCGTAAGAIWDFVIVPVRHAPCSGKQPGVKSGVLVVRPLEAGTGDCNLPTSRIAGGETAKE